VTAESVHTGLAPETDGKFPDRSTAVVKIIAVLSP
jgi:hypothetical protein